MSLKSKYLLNLANTLVNISFPLITFPYASRILDPSGIGEVQFVFSYAKYFAIIAAFGIPIYGIKALSEDINLQNKDSKTLSELLLLGFISSVLMTIVFFLIANVFDQVRIGAKELTIASLLVLLSFLNTDWYFNAKGKFMLLLKRNLIIKIASLTTLFISVREPNDTLGYLVFLVVLHLGLYVINFATILKNEKLDLAGLKLRRHLIPMLTILAMTISTTIYTTLDSVLLGILSDNTNVGLYTAGVKLSKASLPIITSLGVVILPKASEYILKRDQKEILTLYRKVFRFTTITAIPLALILFIYCEELIVLFSGQSFIEATPALRVLSILPLLVAFGHFFSFQILIPSSNNRSIFYSTFIGMILFLVLSFMLMPKFGNLGAAVSNITTEFVVTLMYLIFIPRFIIKGLPWIYFVKIVLCSLIIFPINMVISPIILNQLLSIAFTLVLFGLSYFLILKWLIKESLINDLINLIFSFGKNRG